MQPPEVFFEKRCSKKFRKIHGKHLCQNLFFNKVAGLKPEACNFIKKETLAQAFSCEFCKISKNTFFIELLGMNASVYTYRKYFLLKLLI